MPVRCSPLLTTISDAVFAYAEAWHARSHGAEVEIPAWASYWQRVLQRYRQMFGCYPMERG